MANVVVTIKIMPEGVDADLQVLEAKSLELIKEFAGEGDTKTTIEPIAFGLKSINIIFVMDEAKGAPDELEKKIADLEGVNSAEVTDVRRAVG